MSKSPENPDLVPGFVAVIAGIVVIVVALLLGIFDPITPDADDCAARGKPADCWKASP